MIKCNTENGGSLYFPLDRVISIQNPEKGKMTIKFVKPGGEIGSIGILNFQMVKTGSVYQA